MGFCPCWHGSNDQDAAALGVGYGSGRVGEVILLQELVLAIGIPLLVLLLESERRVSVILWKQDAGDGAACLAGQVFCNHPDRAVLLGVAAGEQPAFCVAVIGVGGGMALLHDPIGDRCGLLRDGEALADGAVHLTDRGRIEGEQPEPGTLQLSLTFPDAAVLAIRATALAASPRRSAAASTQAATPSQGSRNVAPAIGFHWANC